MKKKWYQNNVVVLLLLILFFPAGLFLMWKYSNWSPRKKWVITGFFGIVLLFGMMPSDKSKTTSIEVSQPTSQNQQATEEKPVATQKPSQIDLEAEVRYNSVAFQITNLMDDDWDNCRLTLNGRLFAEDFSYKAGTIGAKEEVVIPFSEFTIGDGTRFNPYEKKAQNLSLSCDVNGTHGFGYYGISQ